MEKIENIIFDVGKVLVEFDGRICTRRLGYKGQLENILLDAVFNSPVWELHDKGDCTDEEYLAQFISNAPDHREDITRVFEHSGYSIQCFDYSQAWCQKLKEAGYHLYILSNYAGKTYETSVQEMKFLPYIDGALFSFQVKQVKPQEDFYYTLLNTYHIDPSASVFLDDRQENLDTAARLGIHTILFQDYGQACQDLKKLGVDA